MNVFFETLRALGAARLAAMAVVGALLMGFFSFVALRVSKPAMAPLYSELSFEDTTAILSQLDSLNIVYETRNDGAAILVPKDDVLLARMRLAEQGLPTGGSLGYEIFDKSDTLGATSFVQNVNHVRALEGELTRTIRSLRRVAAARVHLVLPERELFRRDKKDPSASIVLKTRGTIGAGEIRAIRHIVATAVEGLLPSRVSVVDESGQLLASGAVESDGGLLSSSMQEKALAYERRLGEQIRNIVTSIVGPDRARVQVTADLDYHQVSETSETFDPDGQVARSTQAREESNQANRNASQEGVTAAAQLPNGGENGEGNSENEAGSTTDEVVNYEISKTTRTQTRAAGTIKRLSVAVLVDGIYGADADGNVTYTARPEEELARIKTLLASAVGLDTTRGDKLEVINLRFAEGPRQVSLEGAEPGLFDLTKEDIMRFVELGVLAVVTLLVLLLAVRPLIRKILAPESNLTQSEQMLVELGPDGQPLPTDEEMRAAQENIEASSLLASKPPSRIDEIKALGDEQSQTILSVGKLIEENPQTSVQVIRDWINEAA